MDLDERKIKAINDAQEKIKEATNKLLVNKNVSSNIIKVDFSKKDDE